MGYSGLSRRHSVSGCGGIADGGRHASARECQRAREEEKGQGDPWHGESVPAAGDGIGPRLLAFRLLEFPEERPRLLPEVPALHLEVFGQLLQLRLVADGRVRLAPQQDSDEHCQ